MGLLVVLGALLLGFRVAATEPAATQPPSPVPPQPPVESCVPGSSRPECAPADTPPQPQEEPPCAGPDCIPQPDTPPATEPGSAPACGITNIPGCVTVAINAFFRDLVTSALDPVLILLGNTAFTTPTLASLGVAELWNNSWHLVLACYSTLIMLGGILVMAHESVQTRYSIKEIGPRIVVAFIASALSLFVIDKAVRLANALTAGVLGEGVTAPNLGNTLVDSVHGALSSAVTGALAGGVFLTLMQGAIVVVVIALLLVYVVRVIITLLLVVSAPLWVACHALPHTEGVARWCERALGATLAIQIAQALTLSTAVNTFLAAGTNLFRSLGGLALLLSVLGLLYVLFKIPFWFLSATRISSSRSTLGRMAKAFLAVKTFGLLGGSVARAAPAARAAGGAGPGPSGGGTTGDPAWPPVPHPPVLSPTRAGRLQQQHAAERRRTASISRRASQSPQFLPPTPHSSSHDPASTSAERGSAVLDFSSAPSPHSSPHAPQRSSRTTPEFTDKTRSVWPIRAASVPPHLRFQSAIPEAPSRPVHASSAPEPPVFRPARPAPTPGDARKRTPSVAPVTFQQPTPVQNPGSGGQKS